MQLDSNTLQFIFDDIVREFKAPNPLGGRINCLDKEEKAAISNIESYLKSFGLEYKKDFKDFIGSYFVLNYYHWLAKLPQKNIIPLLENLYSKGKSRFRTCFFKKFDNKKYNKTINRINEYLYNYGYMFFQEGLDVKLSKIEKRKIYKNFEYINHKGLKSIDDMKIIINNFKFNADMKQVVFDRLDELNKTIINSQPLSSLFLCGSILEGVLFSCAENYPKEFNRSISAPKKDGKVKAFHGWQLTELISVAIDIGMIEREARLNLQSLRDFRNYIHPREQLKTNLKPSISTAELTVETLKFVIIQISNYIRVNR